MMGEGFIDLEFDWYGFGTLSKLTQWMLQQNNSDNKKLFILCQRKITKINLESLNWLPFDIYLYNLQYLLSVFVRTFFQTKLNWIYNVADVTINIAGNEGFGLTTAESIMAGTPAIINVTGGLQDQLGLRKKSDGKLFTAEDYKKLGSLHNWRKWEDKVTHGEWVKPVWSRAQTMSGSVPTPYIIDDKVDVYEVAEAIRYWYDKTPKQRTEDGLKIGLLHIKLILASPG